MNKDIVSAIVSEYEKDLYVPDVKPSRQYILCPVGLIGSGKTTVIKPLCKELSLVRISSDDIGEIIHKNSLFVDPETLKEIMETLFTKYLDLGYSLAADTDCATQSNQEFLEKERAAYRLALIWVHINPPESFILEVGLRNKPSWMFKDKAEALEVYEKRKKLHESLSMPFVFTFDTSLANLSEQIEAASKVILCQFEGQGYQ